MNKHKLDALLVILLVAVVLSMVFLIIRMGSEGTRCFQNPMKYAMRTSFVSTGVGGQGLNDVFCTCTGGLGGGGIIITYLSETDELRLGEFLNNDTVIPNLTLNLPHFNSNFSKD